MVRIDSKVPPLILQGADEGTRLEVGYDNRGEPYRDGVSFEVEIGIKDDYTRDAYCRVMLERDEVVQLRDKLNQFLGEKK